MGVGTHFREIIQSTTYVVLESCGKLNLSLDEERDIETEWEKGRTRIVRSFSVINVENEGPEHRYYRNRVTQSSL